MKNEVNDRQTEAPARSQTLARRTRTEHDSLLLAMHQLEAALAAAAPGREQRWNDRVQENLAGVQSALEGHVASTEGDHGLFGEIDLTRPTLVRNVERLRREHVDLIQQAEALRRQVAHYGPEELPAYASIRQQAARLLEAIRHHQAREVDLIFESLFTDIGAGD
jgi:hemerythrin-like domain-containing protein